MATSPTDAHVANSRLDMRRKLVRVRSTFNSRHRIVTVALSHRGPLLLAHALSQLTRTLLDEHLAGSGLSASDFAVYSVVRAEAPVTPTRLATVLGMPSTTLSYVIRQMERRGHLRRVANPQDGRSVLLKLTPAGLRLTERALVGFDHAIRAFRAELDVAEPDLLAHLESMAGALERAITAGADDAADVG